MRILLDTTDIANINMAQLEDDIPALKGKIGYDLATNEAVVADSVNLSPAQIDEIKTHLFDLSRPGGSYDPDRHMAGIRYKQLLREEILPLVGNVPATISDKAMIAKMGGLDSGGKVKPLDEWIAYSRLEIAIMELPGYSA